MPIERGEDWGSVGDVPASTVWAASDADIAAHATAGSEVLRLSAGDLARTLGVTGAQGSGRVATIVPIDLISVYLDEADATLAAAHVVIGAPMRRATAVMNAAFFGRANLAPRAHPGDGRLDIVRFDLGVADWIKASKRLPSGTHIPHPRITTSRVTSWSHESRGRTVVRVDGVVVGRYRSVRCEVLPDAISLAI